MSAPHNPRLEEILSNTDELPSLPAVALEVLRLCRAEDTTLDDLAGALSKDPALAAKLLRFANSSLYGSGEEVRTLQRATLVLGMKTVQLMSLSFSLVTALPKSGQSGGFDYARYWERSLVHAVAARALAGRVGLMTQDEAFLAGLLAEMGQVVLARCLTEPFAEVVHAGEQRGRGWPSIALERELLGLDHREVGGALLQAWDLPLLLEKAVRHGREPGGLEDGHPPELLQLVRVMALAAETTDLFTLRGGPAQLERLQSLADEWFGLSGDELSELLSGLEAPIRETAGMLDLGTPEGYSRILEDARGELVRRSMGQAREIESLRSAIDPDHRARLLAEPALRDPLTGCANEEALRLFLDAEIRARLDGNLARPLGLLLLELDGFGDLPDEDSRTEAQRAMAACLTRLTRKHDLPARVGPGTFAILLGNATPFGQRALAERIRKDLLQSPLQLSSGPLLLTASLGAACLARVSNRQDGGALRDVVARLLQRAGARGPDRHEVHSAMLQLT